MYKRHKYIDRIVPFIDKPVIKVIAGMRRTGKSTIIQLLVNHLVESGVKKELILFINMESLDNSHLTDITELHRFVRGHKKRVGQKLYLFIDEVQEIQDWEKAVNSFFADDDADIFITGSNSKLLSGELATLLTGRYVEFLVYPLVFSEFFQFRNKDMGFTALFNEFLKFGGMPGIHHIEFKGPEIYQYLSAIRDSVALKDVIKRNNIRNVALLEKIMQFVFDNIGNVFSSRKIADYFKKERRSLGHETVYNYLKYLENAFIINKVQRFDLRGKRILETNEKYYLTDIGLGHALLGYSEKKINAYLENIVFIELLYRGYDVKIGKFDDYEVDFIAQKSSERLYIQVCYILSDEKVRNREMRPFYKINDNYPKYLLTMDSIPESNEDGILRRYIPNWLMEKSK
ncbi:MAG: ATP-binding protein [Actinomycetia bacterium]|nr:ATP-binding protein [Actinomycetes bacterium]